MRSLVREIAEAAGRGLVAGAAGTAAMTISSTVEAKVTGRGASSTPADAAGEVAGVQPDEAKGSRFNSLAHWGYGTAWGTVRGLLDLVHLRGPAASALHLGTVWGAEQAVLPALNVGSPVWSYGGKAVATDLLHHTVYAVSTGLVYDWMTGESR